MGPEVSSNRVRPLAALLLTLLAVALPLAAWHETEHRAVRREARRLRFEAWDGAQATVKRLARSVGRDLESLRTAETRRPYFHYQALYHDPSGASEGASVTPSPLLAGPRDPRIRAYFQVDAAGHLTLPTLPQDEPALPVPADLAAQRQARDELSAVAPELTLAAPPLEFARASKQVLQQQVYQINVNSRDVFENVKGGRPALSRSQVSPTLAPDVAVTTGTLEWRTVKLVGGPAILALRRVATPDGELVQGFELSLPTLVDGLRAVEPLASLAHSGRAGAVEAALPVRLGRPWRVGIDASLVSVHGDAAAAALERTFRIRFGLGAAIALLAGVGAVTLAWGAERLARERSQFAAAAAHELRTPLAGLRLHAEMLAEGLGDPTRVAAYARHVANEAERLGRVVGNVLAFTRLERGKLSVRPSRGDVAAAVTSAVERQSAALETQGARIDLDIEDGASAATFDAEALGESLANLLDNAEKHARGATDRTIHVHVAARPAGVVVSIRDHGPGVPKKLRARLFAPFTRGAGSDAPAGLGLGLSLSRSLARAMGGNLSCEDAAGGGAAFVLTLPNTTGRDDPEA